MAALTATSGLLGMAVSAARSVHHGAMPDLPLLALLGIAAGLLAWRGRVAGHGAALVFYALQAAAYHAYDHTRVVGLRGGLSLALVAHLPAGVLVVNAFALAMLAASAALLIRRLRAPLAGPAR